MVFSKRIEQKPSRFLKQKEIVIIFIIGIVLFSNILFYTYIVNTPIFLNKYPRINITCDAKIERDRYSDCEFQLITENPKDSISSKGQIQLQGIINTRLPKKSYRLQLSKHVSILGMRKDDDWTLFALYLDYPRTRIKLSFELWNSLRESDPTAILPDSKYACLYLNGKFKGLYLIAEKLDRKLFNLDNAQNDIQSSLIFQARTFENLGIYKQGQWEQDWPNEDEGIFIMEEILSDLTYFINNTTDNIFFDSEKGIYSKFDKLNLIDFFLFNYFQLHSDFWNNNLYLIRNTYPDKFFLIPWDFDGCFGQKGSHFYNPSENPEPTIRKVNQLYNRLLNNTLFKQDCKDRWYQLREDQFREDYILHKLSGFLMEIEDILDYEMKLWEPEDLKKKAGNEFINEEYINALYDWIPKRLEFCDSYFSEF